MLLSKIALHNFAAFEGTQGFDLSSTGEPKQNIILIGAMNGSGKTSLLEAVKLCLYGEQGSGLVPRKETTPAEFIRSRFNYNARDRHETEMWVELSFSDVELSTSATHQIQVRRTWRFHAVKGTYDQDEFTIHRDGKALEIVGREHWQDFINDTIPPGVAGFFFFDGEKIQQLADDANDRDVLRDSIRTLLGLTVYSRLGNDLLKHTDEIRREADRVTDDQLKQLEADESRTERLLIENREEYFELDISLKNLRAQDALLEQEIRRVIGVGGDSRDDLQRESATAEAEKRSANEEILKVAGDLLPFAIAGRICDELRDRLEAENRLRQWEASKTQVHPQLERIVSSVFFDADVQRPKPDITPTQRTFYAKRLTDEWEALFIPKPKDIADNILHENSPKEERLILSTLEKVCTSTLNTLKELFKQRERAAKRWQDASRELRNVPEDKTHIGELFERRRQSEDKKQELIQAIGRLDDEHAALERELKTLQERIATLRQKLETANFDRRRVQLARKVQSVLETYESRLQAKKLEQLEQFTTEMYALLARKEDFVGTVKINPQTFDVTVSDGQGRSRDKRSLSAGEKQIYAISLLWGLAKASNIELPIIIDTPFARLDSNHRTKIATHYFPHASEQVIVLSTDEEVDQDYVKVLRPYIGRAYLIEHNDSKRSSEVKEGYFYDLSIT